MTTPSNGDLTAFLANVPDPKTRRALQWIFQGGVDLAFGSGSEGVLVQPVRTESFTLQPSDSGTIIPVTGNVTVTVGASSDLLAAVEIRRHDAGTLGVVASGVTLINPATGSAWGTLQVTNKLSSIAIFPGSAADEYSAMKVGA